MSPRVVAISQLFVAVRDFRVKMFQNVGSDFQNTSKPNKMSKIGSIEFWVQEAKENLFEALELILVPTWRMETILTFCAFLPNREQKQI